MHERRGNMYTDITLRFLERIIAVVIGGVAIYLGYRLFLHVPKHRDSQGRVTLPWNTTVILSRVGPGVFFALFGAIVVGLSFVKPIDYTEQELATPASLGSPQATGIEPRRVSRALHGAGTVLHTQVTAAIEEDRAELRKEIAILNTLPKHLKADLPEEDRALLERAIPRMKFKLMKAVWIDEWGNKDQFKQWITTNPSASIPADLEQAGEVFRYPQGGNGP
jgi:hypothetical protein